MRAPPARECDRDARRLRASAAGPRERLRHCARVAWVGGEARDDRRTDPGSDERLHGRVHVGAEDDRRLGSARMQLRLDAPQPTALRVGDERKRRDLLERRHALLASERRVGGDDEHVRVDQ
jgi:hypothetical protein